MRRTTRREDPGVRTNALWGGKGGRITGLAMSLSGAGCRGRAGVTFRGEQHDRRGIRRHRARSEGVRLGDLRKRSKEKPADTIRVIVQTRGTSELQAQQAVDRAISRKHGNARGRFRSFKVLPAVAAELTGEQSPSLQPIRRWKRSSRTSHPGDLHEQPALGAVDRDPRDRGDDPVDGRTASRRSRSSTPVSARSDFSKRLLAIELRLDRHDSVGDGSVTARSWQASSRVGLWLRGRRAESRRSSRSTSSTTPASAT